MNPNNCTPDSWDDQGTDDASVNDLTKAAGSLNVKAVPFVPGQNVFAREFVPFTVGEGGNKGGGEASAIHPPVPAAATPVSLVDTNSRTSVNCTVSAENTSSNNDSTATLPDLGEMTPAPCSGVVTVTEQSEPVVCLPASVCPAVLVNDVASKHENTENSTPPDDWSDKVSENSSTLDERDQDTDSSSLSAARPKKQSRPAQVAARRGDHLNIVFIGHVDAGKSTIGGHIMYLTGMVDKRTLEKYEREAKEKNRESWYLSWALDTNLEERDKGKTVEVGRAYFETDTKHFTILDAPGHKSFVPNMIGGASQADVAVLVISARKGEFETGFERGGQTREHAMLVKTAGVRHLIIVVNKMDDPTVEWDEARFNEIRDKLTPYLRKCGFNPKTDIYFIPVSGLTGINLKDVTREMCPWYDGPSLIQYLDALPSVSRMNEGPVRMPIVDRYKDMGTIVLGKVESGVISKGQMLTIMPNKMAVEVMQLFSDEDETEQVSPGENVKIKL